jgi:4-hydroxy-tetrahydrodipicolinate synthase
MFEELVGHPNIQAIKDSTRDITNITRMINRFGDRFSLMCGVDTLAMEALLMGASGWVAGLVCAFPNETVALYNLVRAGKLQRALKLYRWFMPLLELDTHPKLVQYIKLAAQETGLGTEYVRSPRLPLSGPERERILAVIRKALENRPAPDELKVD